MEVQKKEGSYCISRCADEQGSRSPVGNQAGIKKLVIETKTDSNGNNSGTNDETTKQIYDAGIPIKETTATVKEKSNLPVEVKAKTYYDLKLMARKSLKYGQVESILIHLQNTPLYNAIYKKEESEVKAQIALIKGVAEATTTEEKNVNMWRSVTLEHCFGGEKTQETTRRRKTPR